MTKAELLQKAKPIIFDTESVRAILDGRKTAARTVIKLPDGLSGHIVYEFGDKGKPLDKMGVSPTLTTMGGGNRQPMILDCVPCRMVGRNPDAPKSRKKGLPTEQRIELKREDCSNTITTVQKDSMVLDLNNIGIRKLTPRECYRLMGVDDSDIDKMLAVVSNSQAYKQAGNSIVVDVLAAIFKQLL